MTLYRSVSCSGFDSRARKKQLFRIFLIELCIRINVEFVNKSSDY